MANPQTTYYLQLSKMRCAGCVHSIERALSAVPGVNQVSVDFAASSATVVATCGVDNLIAAVERLGYAATIADNVIFDDSSDEHNVKQLYQQAAVAGLVGVPLLVLGWLQLLPGLQAGVAQLFWLGIAVLTAVVMFFSGQSYYRGAVQSAMACNANMDTLIALGTFAAWLYSTAVVIFPDIIPSLARHAYFEATAIILALINLGSALEVGAKKKTSAAIRQLLGLQPKTAEVMRAGQSVTVSIADLQLGDVIRIKPGEKIPVDGVLVEGESTVDQSMLTGESVAVGKHINDKVYAGTINKTGSFLFTASSIGNDTVLAHIIALVHKAQNSKPAIGRLADKIASKFVPAVIIIALITGLVWFMVGPEPKAAYVLVTTMTVLIIACPCALGLATPIALMVGIGKAAQQGILISNSDALQQASRLTTVVLDKTGTITAGKPCVVALACTTSSISEDELLRLAASLEVHSEHSLATAIVDYAQQQSLDLVKATNFRAIPGKGVCAEYDKQTLYLGNKELMAEQHIDIAGLEDKWLEYATQGQTPMMLAKEQQLLGIISISDPIKTDAEAAISMLRQRGLKVIMLTGDNKQTAQAVAKQVSISEVIAEVLPQDKAEKISQLQAQGEIVGMVGDGINDAPALAMAHVGFALASGTDVAIASADISLMSNSIASVNEAIMLSKATLRTIWQNLFGAFIYNVLSIPIAAGVLFPFNGMLLNPMIAGAAMAMSSLTVVSNANRLRYVKLTGNG